jgi:hypothetical protein
MARGLFIDFYVIISLSINYTHTRTRTHKDQSKVLKSYTTDVSICKIVKERNNL